MLAFKAASGVLLDCTSNSVNPAGQKMARARLNSVTIERFKSHALPTTVNFGALTVLLGRNNSGKSSVLQALLLLKQTLDFHRSDVPLHLKGAVEALSLRELTYGWPEASEGETIGPKFAIVWTSDIDFSSASKARIYDLSEGEIPSPAADYSSASTKLTLEYSDLNSKVILKHIRLESIGPNNSGMENRLFTFERQADGGYICLHNGHTAKKIVVEMDHFLPYITIDKRNVGPRHRERGWVNTFSDHFLQPIEDLRLLLSRFEYLSSTRALQPALYTKSSISPDNIGISGEQAAELLQANRNSYVRYFPPSAVCYNAGSVPVKGKLQDAVNDVLREMGIDIPLSIHDIPDVGFRLLFGKSSLQHVGRGLTYLLPIVELGLICDPMRFKNNDVTTRSDYEAYGSSICAFEEPEAHLHPKVQSRLAEWFVALGQAQRQVVVETHSDHLVRRLRSLVAETPVNGELERWLIENIYIVNVEQESGVSSVRSTRLTRDGSIEDWPSDFFDEATKQENTIYSAALEKEHMDEIGSSIHFDHRPESEPHDTDS